MNRKKPLNYRDPGLYLVLGLFVFANHVWPSGSEPLVATPPGGTAAFSAAPVTEPPAVKSLTDLEAKALAREFRKSQSTQLKALEHRQKLELKELTVSQAARKKEWNQREKEARHRFFSENSRGPDRRAYVKDFVGRRQEFLKTLSDEVVARKKEAEEARKSLKIEHENRAKEFQEYLKRNERPPESLWPKKGT